MVTAIIAWECVWGTLGLRKAFHGLVDRLRNLRNNFENIPL